MPPPTVKFNVGGTVFEVAASMIQARPEGLLAKMIDGRFECEKDVGGAYFVYRNPRFFRIVLDVHRGNKVVPFMGVTRERVLAELEFYGLEDFDGDPIDRSVQATLRGVGDVTGDFFKWQEEQEKIGKSMLTEALARLLLARAEPSKSPGPPSLEISGDNLAKLEQAMSDASCNFFPSHKSFEKEIPKILAGWKIKATYSSENVGCNGKTTPSIKLERAEPDAGG
ncbi:hypothetical protein T484DRAFT_1746699 [Baffinella frigidus]|nr:hypothetical protein T484DRAFT_1746699 [Cryptophyta sp. CCMP2293]